MANPITEIKQNEISATLRILGEVGATTEHSDWMRGRGNAALLIQFIEQQRCLLGKNPYEMTVEQQLTALRRANDEEKWGLTEDDFARLASSAPVWPKGKSAYRSFRIRFGEGDDGVADLRGALRPHPARLRRGSLLPLGAPLLGQSRVQGHVRGAPAAPEWQPHAPRGRRVDRGRPRHQPQA